MRVVGMLLLIAGVGMVYLGIAQHATFATAWVALKSVLSPAKASASA